MQTPDEASYAVMGFVAGIFNKKQKAYFGLSFLLFSASILRIDVNYQFCCLFCYIVTLSSNIITNCVFESRQIQNLEVFPVRRIFNSVYIFYGCLFTLCSNCFITVNGRMCFHIPIIVIFIINIGFMKLFCSIPNNGLFYLKCLLVIVAESLYILSYYVKTIFGYSRSTNEFLIINMIYMFILVLLCGIYYSIRDQAYSGKLLIRVTINKYLLQA
jgi:hypothetical protein